MDKIFKVADKWIIDFSHVPESESAKPCLGVREEEANGGVTAGVPYTSREHDNEDIDRVQLCKHMQICVSDCPGN